MSFETSSLHSRRTALQLTGGAMAAGVASMMSRSPLRANAQEAEEATPEEGASQPDELGTKIEALLTAFPGTHAYAFWAPPEGDRAAWATTLNGDLPMFVASVFKLFVLTEYLRQAEADLDPTAEISLANQLDARLGQEMSLDATVFSPGSGVFNPPNLTGLVTARTVLEAMIAHSDNTATDMALLAVGPQRVRELIAAQGLTQTRIPESTRQILAFAFGVPNWQTATWDEMMAAPEVDSARLPPLLNDTITSASTANELVAFLQSALQGDLFRYPETLTIYRAILAMPEIIPGIMPLGVNPFLMSGSITSPGENIQAVAGGMFVANRWVYFAVLNSWTAAEWGKLEEVQPIIWQAMKDAFTLIRDELPGWQR